MRCGDVWELVGVKGCGRGCGGMRMRPWSVCAVKFGQTCAACRAPSDHQIREAALAGCGCRRESAGRKESRPRDCALPPSFSLPSDLQYRIQTRLTILDNRLSKQQQDVCDQ